MDSGLHSPDMVWDWIEHRAGNQKLVPKIREAMAWLSGSEVRLFEARTDLNNLALGYANALEEMEHGGKWSQATAELSNLATAAEALAAAIRGLGFTATTVLIKEPFRDSEDIREAAGLNDLFHGFTNGAELEEINLTADNSTNSEIEKNSSVSEVTLSGKFQILHSHRPAWLVRSEAMCHLARECASAAKAIGKKGGRRKSSTHYFGSPDLQLMTDCARMLVLRAQDERRFYLLAKVVHHLVKGEAPADDWADDDKRLFKEWWPQVRDWIMNPEAAPKDVLDRINAGPHSKTKRRSRGDSALKG